MSSAILDLYDYVVLGSPENNINDFIFLFLLLVYNNYSYIRVIEIIVKIYATNFPILIINRRIVGIITFNTTVLNIEKF